MTSIFSRNLIIYWIGSLTAGTGLAMNITLTALAGKSLAPRADWATLPLAGFFLGMLVFALPTALILKRLGRKWGHFLGFIPGLSGALLAALALASDQFLLFVCGIFLLGVCHTFNLQFRFAASEASPPALRPKAVSFIFTAGIVAAIVAKFLADFSSGYLEQTPFVAAYLAMALIFLIPLILLALALDKSKLLYKDQGAADQHAATRPRPLFRVATQPKYIIALFAAVVAYVVMNFVMVATPLAVEGSGFSQQQSNSIIMAHILGMFVPSFFTGGLINRFGHMPMLGAGLAFELVAVSLNLMEPSLMGFYLALVALGIGWNFLFITSTSLLTTTYTKEERGYAQGFNELIVALGLACSSLYSGAAYFGMGWAKLNLSAMPFLLLLGGAILLLPLVERRRAA